MPAVRSDRPRGTAGLEIRVRGWFGDAEREHLYREIGAVLGRHALAVDGARVRLTGSHRVGGPVLVQVNLRVCGAPARIQVAGSGSAQAIAAAAARLDRQVRRLSTGWEPWPWPDPQRRALGVPGRGTISRRKAYAIRTVMPCQAAATMDAMDYDVHLYTDAETGEDAVVYRAGPAGLCLARQYTRHPARSPAGPRLTINPRATPTLDPDQAAIRLAEGWLPFLFYTDRETRRGNLLYRRYDGDLAVILPGTGSHPVIPVTPGSSRPQVEVHGAPGSPKPSQGWVATFSISAIMRLRDRLWRSGGNAASAARA